jgi:menaquinone-dependent protoporphyrinogen IX oxidase
MTSFVVHSSKTGKTKKLAESVCVHLPNGTILFPVNDSPDPVD